MSATHIDPELLLYRDFYETWEKFQTTNDSAASPDTKLESAKALVLAFDRVKNFRNPVTMLPAANG